MSSKVGIKWKEQTDSSPGFRLYEDALDEFTRQGTEELPVYLQLDGVEVELETLKPGGASVTVKIPREIARELGLLPPIVTAAPSNE